MPDFSSITVNSDPVAKYLQHKIDIANAEFKERYPKHEELRKNQAYQETRVRESITAANPQIKEGGAAFPTYPLFHTKADIEMMSSHHTAAEIASKESERLLQEIEKIETTKEFQELDTFLQQAKKELDEHNKKLEEEALIPDDAPGFTNWVKRNFQKLKRNLLPTALTAGDLSGTVGFVTNIYLNVFKVVEQVAAGARFFFGVISSPLALGVMAAFTLLDTFAVWRNEKMKQRKTRYLANLATLGLLAVAIPVVLGVIAAPVVAVPLLFLGINMLGHFKDEYILKQTRGDIQTEELSLKEKEAELQEQINTIIFNDNSLTQNNLETYKHYVKLHYHQQPENIKQYALSKQFLTNTSIHKENIDEKSKQMAQQLIKSNPRIQRLAIQINEHKDRIDNLKMTVKHMEEGKQLRKVFLFSVACLITGGVFSLLPPLIPLAALFTLVGAAVILGAVFAGTYLRYKQQAEIAAAAKAKQHISQYENSERETVADNYLQTLKHKHYDDNHTELCDKIEQNSSSKVTMRALGGAEAFASAQTKSIAGIDVSGIPESPLSIFAKRLSQAAIATTATVHTDSKHSSNSTASAAKTAKR